MVEHSSMDEILDEVKQMEGVQKALSLMMRNNPQSGGTISKGSSSNNRSDASKNGSTNNSDHQQYKFVRKGNLVYRRPLDRDRSTSAVETHTSLGAHIPISVHPSSFALLSTATRTQPA